MDGEESKVFLVFFERSLCFFFFLKGPLRLLFYLFICVMMGKRYNVIFFLFHWELSSSSHSGRWGAVN